MFDIISLYRNVNGKPQLIKTSFWAVFKGNEPKYVETGSKWVTEGVGVGRGRVTATSWEFLLGWWDVLKSVG